MALPRIKKIELIAYAKHKKAILDLLQKAGTMEISTLENSPEEFKKIKELQNTELAHANLSFTIQILSNYEKKKGLLAQPQSMTAEELEEKAQEIEWKKIIEECNDLEEKRVKAKNQINSLKNELETLNPWKSLKISLENISNTENTSIIIGNVPIINFPDFLEKTHKLSNLISSEVISTDKKFTYFYLIFNKELEEKIKELLTENKFQETELPKINETIQEYYQKAEEEIKENEKILKNCEKELTNLAKSIDDTKIVYDYIGWELEKLQTEKELIETNSSFVLTGWVPEKTLKKLEEELNKVGSEWTIREIKPKEGEKIPVIIENPKFLIPFEAVSKIYGLPKATEVDPTPFLAIFFIGFFALALTDAGYGLMMFIMMALILKYFKLGEGIKTLVKLLMYSGIVTFFIGALFGGWWGFTVEQMPSWLTYTSSTGEELILLQKINPVTNPLTVLILSLTLGYIQIIFGILIKLLHNIKTGYKKEAILDNGTWIFMLLGWGVLVLGMAFGSPFLSSLAKWWLILAAILLIITQGRDNKNPILKFASGILSLYGLVGYMSDILSYSRLLALGLATTIIGMAVNIVAELVGGLPFIGWLFMLLVFVGGHIFNLIINTLGSFIHSGRLQFVEFFTKFLEGGGREFKPFSKKTKHIFLNNS